AKQKWMCELRLIVIDPEQRFDVAVRKFCDDLKRSLRRNGLRHQAIEDERLRDLEITTRDNLAAPVIDARTITEPGALFPHFGDLISWKKIFFIPFRGPAL